MALRIVSRAEWGARPATRRVAIDTPTPRLWLHHTAGNERGAAGMRQIQAFHMDTKGWSDIAYSLVVDPLTLTVYEGRGIGIAGGHTKGDNTQSHAICVMGSFEQLHPSAALLRLLADLVREGRDKGWWHDLTGGHRQAPGAQTACPGRFLQAAIPEIQALSRATVAPTPEENDMARIVRGDKTPHWWITDGLHKDYIEHVDRAKELVFAGLATWDGDKPFSVSQAMVDNIPTVVKPESVAAAVLASLPPAQAGGLTADQIADEIYKRLAS